MFIGATHSLWNLSGGNRCVGKVQRSPLTNMWRREFSPSRFYQNLVNLWENVKLFLQQIYKNMLYAFIMLIANDWFRKYVRGLVKTLICILLWFGLVKWLGRNGGPSGLLWWIIPSLLSTQPSLTHLLHGRQPWTNMFASKFMWISDVLDVLGFITCFTFTPRACVSVVLQASYETQTR